MKKAFLIDFENVKSAGLVGLEQLSAADEVVVLYSANSNTISFEMHQKILQSPACVDYYQIRRGGKNSLDFQLSSLLGYLLGTGAYSHLYVVSNDAGFDVLRDFWTSDFVPNECVVYRRGNLAACLAHARLLEEGRQPQADTAQPQPEAAAEQPAPSLFLSPRSSRPSLWRRRRSRFNRWKLSLPPRNSPSSRKSARRNPSPSAVPSARAAAAAKTRSSLKISLRVSLSPKLPWRKPAVPPWSRLSPLPLWLWPMRLPAGR